MAMTSEENLLAMLAHERLTILECAVKALIAEHPNPEAVRTRFDLFYAQMPRAKFAPAGLRKLVASLFDESGRNTPKSTSVVGNLDR